MNEIGEKYLPIGTVVMLKGGTKRAMITGFCSVAGDDSSKVYDYSGCVFPEGYVSSNQVCLFDHNQIEKVYHMGLVDDEEQAFKTKLKGLMAENNNGAAPADVQPAPSLEPSVAVEPVAPVEPVSPVVPEVAPVDLPPVSPEVTPVDVSPLPEIPPAPPVPTVEPVAPTDPMMPPVPPAPVEAAPVDVPPLPEIPPVPPVPTVEPVAPTDPMMPPVPPSPVEPSVNVQPINPDNSNM